MDDLRAGTDFYEEQNLGLGNYFLDSLFSDIDSLLLYAGIHSTVFSHYRLLSKRFPYAIYYKQEEDVVTVHQPYHHPSSIRRVLTTLSLPS